MIQPIGSTQGYPPTPTASTGALTAQLATLEGQLAECLHCATANTAAGKAKIQALTTRIQALRARLEAARNSNPAQSPPRAPMPGMDDPNANRNTRDERPKASSGSLGVNVDLNA